MFIWEKFLKPALKAILKETALRISVSFLMAAGSCFLGWFFDLLGIQTEMKKIAIIASLFLSASMPLIILFVVVFIACMGIFWILKLVLPSQRFASDAKKILKTLNLVREYLDSRHLRKENNPFLVFQSIEDLKNTVMKKHKIRYPSITAENENYFPVWFGVLSNLHGFAVDADLKAAQHMRYDLIDKKEFRELRT